MSETKKNAEATEEVKEETAAAEAAAEDTAAEEAAPEQAEEQTPSELELAKEQAAKEQAAKEHDNYLRLAAEYDNFRKRSQKEKDNLYTEIRSETVGKFLPVYDNLERALNQETADEAYKKGVELTMNQLIDIMGKLGVEGFGEKGDSFDPAIHNAVMHCEDETLGENVIAEVFQKGFKVGEKVVRFAMVKVAN